MNKHNFVPLSSTYLEIFETTLPKTVLDILDNSPCVLAGGALVSLALKQPVNDYDLFYEGAAQSQAQSDMLAADPNDRRTVFAQTVNGITTELEGGLVCQFITNHDFCAGPRSMSLAERVLSNIDFTICRMAVWSVDGELYGIRDFRTICDLEEKRLTYRSVQNPLGSLCRVVKYAHRGFKMPTKDYARLLARFVVEYRDEALMEQPLDHTEQRFADLFAEKIPGCAVSPR